MADPFIGEIRIFAGNFAPRGWAFCNGQLLDIAQNTALFSIVGTTYGGDGRTTLGLPNLQGRAPLHPGRGPGLTQRRLGESGGVETVTLTEAQIPNHTHQLNASDEEADRRTPASDRLMAEAVGGSPYGPASNLVDLDDRSLPEVGGNQPHANMQPYLAMNFVIALQGVFPNRS